MEFFEMDQSTQRLHVSPQIWQFFVAATGTTVLTMLLYYLMAGFPQIRKQRRMAEERESGLEPEEVRRRSINIEKSAQSADV